MIPPFGVMQRSLARRTDRIRHRAKSTAFPLGAGRGRLARLICSLGLYDDRIAARIQGEKSLAERLEAVRAAEQRHADARARERARQAREAQWFAWQIRRQRLARLWAQERAALEREQREFVLLLKEELAQRAMSPDQEEAYRLEEQVVAWLTTD